MVVGEVYVLSLSMNQGKSSLLLALFRIIEGVEGSILIDGLDIKNMGLHDCKSWIPVDRGTVEYLQCAVRYLSFRRCQTCLKGLYGKTLIPLASMMT